MKYEDSKNCLIYASDIDDTAIFFVIERDGKYFAFYYCSYSNPAILFNTYDSKQEFIQNITWHDWIIEGIKDEGFKDEVIKFNLFDKEIIDGKGN
jgi:hypothetical protein